MPSEEWWNWKGNNVHLDTFRNPDAKAKIILFHGVGTNGRQMSMILGGTLAKNGYEVIAIDMPLYGVTEVNKKMLITYNDWVQLGSDYIDYELSKIIAQLFYMDYPQVEWKHTMLLVKAKSKRYYRNDILGSKRANCKE